MTLQELNLRFEENKLKYTYGNFENDDVKLPYFTAHSLENISFFAEDVTFFSGSHIQLDYFFEKKDLNIENIIENKILRDVAYTKSEEEFNSTAQCWNISYTFFL